MKKEDLKIVFLGTPEFAVVSLARLLDEGCNIVGVVTAPDKPAGRGKQLRGSAVKEFAESRGLKVMQPVNLKDHAFVDELRSLDADLFIVIAFRMLPEVVWQMPRLGTFNLHASLLPRYRGAAPINWAVINGDTRTGVTTFFLKHEIDTGDIIDRETIEILPEDNAGTVHDKLMALGAELTLKTVEAICYGTLKPLPQDHFDDVEPAPAPKIFKETCRIDWARPATTIHNLVRGLSPNPAAWTTLEADDRDCGTMKIYETRLTDTESGGRKPGTVVVSEDGRQMFVASVDKMIELLSIQAPGKKRMSTADFLRGCRQKINRLL